MPVARPLVYQHLVTPRGARIAVLTQTICYGLLRNGVRLGCGRVGDAGIRDEHGSQTFVTSNSLPTGSRFARCCSLRNDCATTESCCCRRRLWIWRLCSLVRRPPPGYRPRKGDKDGIRTLFLPGSAQT